MSYARLGVAENFRMCFFFVPFSFCPFVRLILFRHMNIFLRRPREAEMAIVCITRAFVCFMVCCVCLFEPLHCLSSDQWRTSFAFLLSFPSLLLFFFGILFFFLFIFIPWFNRLQELVLLRICQRLLCIWINQRFGLAISTLCTCWARCI